MAEGVGQFEALGDALSYRTFYARMSSETHADAEETIRYFIGKVHDDPAVLKKMAQETVMMTRFNVPHAVEWFLKASIAYAAYYRLPEVSER